MRRNGVLILAALPCSCGQVLTDVSICVNPASNALKLKISDDEQVLLSHRGVSGWSGAASFIAAGNLSALSTPTRSFGSNITMALDLHQGLGQGRLFYKNDGGAWMSLSAAEKFALNPSSSHP